MALRVRGAERRQLARWRDHPRPARRGGDAGAAPGGRAPAEGDKPADIVVVVKGPTQSVLVREKEKVAGIWVNADRTRYRSAPSFYAIASSRPISAPSR